MSTADTLITDRPLGFATQVTTPQESYGKQKDDSLRDSVEKAVSNYFKHLDGQDVSNVYEMVLAEVEAPLLEVVMKYTRHNQTRAANILGLNRGTLRKKLKQYGLL